jgi:hypothetical protein
MKYVISIVILSLLNCVSVASLERFPKSTSQINFGELENIKFEDKEGIWNLKTDYECLLIVNNQLADVEAQTENALLKTGYKIKVKDKSEKLIIGERGMRPNEWNSITGIYYKPKNDTVIIYIKNEITQDITGGWKENRAKEIGKLLCKNLKCLPK